MGFLLQVVKKINLDNLRVSYILNVILGNILQLRKAKFGNT